MSDSPKGPDPNNPIDEAVAALIKRKAARMVGRAGLRVQDREDLEQQLAQHVLERRGSYNPRRGTWSAFVRRVVERHGENLIRARRAAKRYGGALGSPTDEPIGHGDDAEVHARTVAAALATLPAELRRVAELVMAGTVTGAARTLGISRSTVYARLREISTRPEFQEFGDDP